MKRKTLELKFDNQKFEVPAGTSPLEIIDNLELKLDSKENPLLGSVINQRMVSLRKPLDQSGEIDFIRYRDRYGEEFYRRGLCLVLGAACNRLFEDENLRVGHSIEHGYFYRLTGEQSVSREKLLEIEQEMKKLIAEDLPFEVERIEHNKALKIFQNYSDKSKLLKTWDNKSVEIHRLGDYIDLAYFPAPARTGQLQSFELRPYTPGFILRFPEENNPGKISPPVDQPQLFQIYQETREWAKILEVKNVGTLNEIINAGDITEFIKISEALHERKTIQIADNIHRNLKNINLVTISGPSSSGKTTFAKRLSIQLRVQGIKPLRISTDDYFVNREDTPRDADGNYNFEALEAIDLELFNEHLIKLLEGKKVEMPQFSFENGKRKKQTVPLQLTADQLLIIEGIHGLNPQLTRAVDRHRKYLIYVSALTQLVIDNHNRISTSDSRLIRRIVRDTMFRSIKATTNIRRWPSVRRGEGHYIFPYQEDADAMFNSSLLYELAVLKPFIKSALKEVNKTKQAYRTAHRIQRFVDLFETVDSGEIPPTSILREFIGGSSFRY